MATDVGSLNASLTLDLSNFRAGMSEAASLAAQLATQLQSVFAGDLGFSRMTAEILEMIAQVGNLSAAMESFRASLAAITGADMFAQMRTHTAALPSEIASITSGLISAQTAAAQLVMTMQSVATSAATVSASVAGMSLGSFSGATLDFSAPLAQIEQMQSAMAALFAQMERFNTVDMSTGEVMGSGDSAPAFTNILNITQQINATLQEVAASIQACTAATTEWATVTRQVSTMFGSIPDSLKAASAAAKSANTATKGAGSGASNFAGQTGKAAKNLQTSKGYAVSIKGILGGIIISQAFYQMVNIMQELISKAIEFSETLQDAAVAFNYLFQDSTQSADAFLNALKSMALVSPLDTTDLTAASRKLMAMGFSAEATVPTLQILTDTAAVFSNSAADMSDQIDHIALAFGQMIASGKVSAQELRQLYNAGLPIYELLSEGLGITLEQAKNIGDLGVDATSAVFAVLQELQQRYEGAAEALSHTLSGSISRIQEAFQQMLSYAWEAPFEKLTTIVDSAANHIVALVKITQAYGIGGLFQALFPESSWSVLRNFIGGLIQVGSVIKQFGQLFFTVFGDAIAIIIKVGSVVLPILANLANIILYLIRAAYNASPAVKILFQTIAVLAIGAVIAKVVVFLAKAIWLLTGLRQPLKQLVV
jgi:tape measure domain-containing protein